MTPEERQRLRHEVSERRRQLVAKAHGNAQSVRAKHRGDPTDRELQILRLFAGGRTGRQIADELFVSIQTVKTHLSHVREKFDAATTAEACAIAVRMGWIE